MPDLIDSTSVTWAESGGDLSATATGRVASVQVDDDGTIGSASDADAMQIAADGSITLSQDLTVPNVVLDDDGTIGSATDTDAIAISSAGVVTINEDLIVGGSHRAASVEVNAQSGTSYTLVLSDAGKLVTLDNSSAVTLTVPPNSSVAFQVGATIALAQLGAGTVSVAEGSGVTVSSLDDNSDLSGQYATASLVKTGTDAWLLVGALA